MINENIMLEVTRAQLDYLLELATQDIALSLMTLGRLENTKIRARLELRINSNKTLLHQLKALKHETTTHVSTNGI